MTTPEPFELLVRAVALYVPILLTIALALHARPSRRRTAGAMLATAWNVSALLAVNLVAVRAGWWTFDAGAPLVAGFPADLWIGWALLWGAVPILATTNRLLVVGIVLVAADLVLMPLAEPVVHLHGTWLLGEAVAVTTCLVPGLLLGRWTVEGEHLRGRAFLQVAAFTGLLFFVLPSVIFAVTGEGWAPLLDRPRWQFVLCGVLVAPVGAMAVQAVCEFVAHGGTPVPLDPPIELVTSGPYAYVANPMQLGATILLAAWGVVLASPAVVAAAGMGAVFSAGLATWSEDTDLVTRFGDEWRRYRRRVRVWLPSWRPAVFVPGVVWAAAGCEPCNEIGQFLDRRPSIGLDVRAAEQCPDSLERITYRRGTERVAGLAAIGRSLEHVNLAWACLSWIGRLPVLSQFLQLVTDAIGGGPRPVGRTAGT
jgi:protein-S-isoprenylcysteine O-methyltransferase Ste14